MNINELIMNITDRFKMPSDQSELQKVTNIYRKDFGFYSESKLDKVWYAIKRHHRTNFAPNYSAIVDCMEKAGIGESKETGDSNFYQRCTTCGAKYSMGVCSCPKCNKHLPFTDGVPEIFNNSVEVIKCQTLPHDLIKLRQACPICPLFRSAAMYPRGIKCDSFQTELRGTLKDCENCKCKACCHDLGSKNEEMPDGVLLEVVLDKVASKCKMKKGEKSE